MILVFGGTTEGKAIAQALDQLQLSYFYSTKTASQSMEMDHGKMVVGGMDRNQLKQFCIDQGIQLIINGSHPFAEILHQTIGEVADLLQIPVFRLEREFPDRENSDKIIYLDNFQHAVQYLTEKKTSSLLALTGVQTVPKLQAYWEQHQCWFRILDRKESYQKAEAYGFPSQYLIGETPEDSVAYEMELIRKLKPQAILTKESGVSGYYHNKLEAAKRMGVPFLVVKRPKLPANFQLVHSIEDLRCHLHPFQSPTNSN